MSGPVWSYRSKPGRLLRGKQTILSSRPEARRGNPARVRGRGWKHGIDPAGRASSRGGSKHEEDPGRDTPAGPPLVDVSLADFSYENLRPLL